MAKGNDIQVTANSVSLISAGTEIRGEIDCGGDLRIDGTVVGSLSVRGKVVIGESGRVEGELQCKNGDVSGYLNGKIQVAELLNLKSTAKMFADVTTQRLGIEPGAVFTGSCQMGEPNTPAASYEGQAEK
jgi:hypothetical protein